MRRMLFGHRRHDSPNGLGRECFMTFIRGQVDAKAFFGQGGDNPKFLVCADSAHEFVELCRASVLLQQFLCALEQFGVVLAGLQKLFHFARLQLRLGLTQQLHGLGEIEFIRLLGRIVQHLLNISRLAAF